MKYENVQCPVCSEKFTYEDNVVVCPTCGTPHHRECYEKLGRCVNVDQHKEDYVWNNPEQEEITKQVEKEQLKKESKGTTKDKSINLPKNMNPYEKEELLKMVGYRKLEPHEKIGGITVEDYGTYANKRKHKYLPKFYRMSKTGSRISWNWVAFFFPVPWLFYRKMFKVGVLVAILIAIVPAVFTKQFTDHYQEALQVQKTAIEREDLNLNEVREALPEPPLAHTATSYIFFTCQIILGLFGNYIYMKKANKDIKEIRRIKQDEQLSLEQIRKKGSPSIKFIVLALVVIGLVLNIAVYKTYASGHDLSVYVDRIVSIFQK